ncbi:TRAM domain-containing protein [Salinarchaeum sp. IM2453]|uniref:TRAM domain-containing protein n=1 Tax=Salinarchaeum sp. IM2453 TaxID=2862870 RepID=UPI001C83E418|nr:TRAM domain-containing protein [Salinarchaeum sp. IM2453]QZA89006.1 TRAM domain-containing protein [Salinarchaeum sp. IM2453]
MVDIPDSLRSLFTASVEEHDEDDRYVIEIPKSEIEHETVEPAETYKVALLSRTTTDASTPEYATSAPEGEEQHQTPPVEEGETRTVTIESLGDKGDGIAKVERGYVLIVPGARPGDEVTVKVEEVRENVAFAELVDDPAVE